MSIRLSNMLGGKEKVPLRLNSAISGIDLVLRFQLGCEFKNEYYSIIISIKFIIHVECCASLVVRLGKPHFHAGQSLTFI